MENSVQEPKQERSAVNKFGVGRISEAGNGLSMEDAVDESGNGEHEADERTGSADIKQGAVSEDGRANQDEGAEGTVQVGEGNEKGIGGANVVVAAGKKMAEFVSEENGHQSQRERKTGGEADRVFIEESERAKKFIRREGLVLRIGGGELCAGDEAGAQRQEKENAGE